MIQEFIRENALREKSYLEDLITSDPEVTKAEQFAIKMRLHALGEKIKYYSGPSSPKQKAETILTFYGEPVLGSKAIYADFAGLALTAFQDLVGSCLTRLHRKMKQVDSGFPSDYQLLPLAITGTVHGSFGFKLEEISDSPDLQDRMLGSTLLNEALSEAIKIFELTNLEKGEFLNQARQLDARTVNALSDFLDVIKTRNATFRITATDMQDLLFDEGRVSHALSVASGIVQRGDFEPFIGILSGIFINARRFEFTTREGKVLSGEISETLDPHSLTAFLEQPCEVLLFIEMEIKVGKRRPRGKYTLTSIKHIAEDSHN